MGGSIKLIHNNNAEYIKAVTVALYRFEAEHGIGELIKAQSAADDTAREGVFALAGNVLVGGLTFHIYNDWVYLHCGYVWEEYRGTGVYKALLQSVEDKARKAGFSGILTATYDFEAPAVYEHMGFVRGSVLTNCPKGNTSIDCVKDFSMSAALGEERGENGQDL